MGGDDFSGDIVDLMGAWRMWLDRAALPLGLLGLAAVAAYNWRQWQRDKSLLAQIQEPEPLPPLEEWPELPLVSVLVAAWNEADFIERHIESFRALRYPNKELVLCAGGDDKTYELAREHAGEGIAVLEQQLGEGKQHALERGLSRAAGSIIFLTDADCLLDDISFERTLFFVASGAEQVCTGASLPYPEQMTDPFVFGQISSQLYGTLHVPRYAAGLLGRNCAVSRTLLEESEGLSEPAATGTDYVVAKVLVAAGARIRQLPTSRVATHYPEGPAEYIQQQRRWLCNVALHGRRFRAMDEVRAAVKTSLVGLVMLTIPVLALVLWRLLLLPWSLLIFHGWLSRARHLLLTSRALKTPLRSQHFYIQLPFLFVDFFAWVRPLADYLVPKSRGEW